MRQAASCRRRAFLTWAMVLSVAVSGCTVGSTHPLAPLAASEPVPESLIGVWDFVEMVGLSAVDKDYEFSIERNVDGSFKTFLQEPAGRFETHASLTTVGDLSILSIPPDEGEMYWTFASIDYDPETQQLAVDFLGHVEVVRDIRLGRVEGEVFQFDQDERARLTAGPEELRTYFANHGVDAFSDRVMVLRKRSSIATQTSEN